ncbi:hypothetical protein AV926_18375 [Myroides marinus]|uniref:Uncharacterized protein n=1 Tax=Myroides marinus TaxID=703342 RepID=A0A163UI31_9FLAO|nr:hypothetical protein [Myroides marinus]KZE73350.1 hypothetical protein AV926_18375 [Myroides marinus]
MFYLLSTKNGIGFELWGSYEDLSSLYYSFDGLWNNEEYLDRPDFNSRESIITSMLYNIRKTFQGNRLERKGTHFHFNDTPYFGCRISWIHGLFFLHAVRYNTRYFNINKLQLANLLQLEYWLEKAMYSYDPVGAVNLSRYITGGIDASNDCLYIYMRRINLDFFLLNGGKKAFRQLPELLKKACFGTSEYLAYRTELEEDAKKLKTIAPKLELDDDTFDYDRVKW